MSILHTCYLNKIQLTKGGYATGRNGKYYGVGMPVYRYTYEGEKGTEYGELRATDREDAKRQIWEKYPDAAFFRLPFDM